MVAITKQYSEAGKEMAERFSAKFGATLTRYFGNRFSKDMMTEDLDRDMDVFRETEDVYRSRCITG